MPTLYVYNPDTRKVVAKIDGASNQECEAVAAQQYGDTDYYAWTYTPAFGAKDGLHE